MGNVQRNSDLVAFREALTIGISMIHVLYRPRNHEKLTKYVTNGKHNKNNQI